MLRFKTCLFFILAKTYGASTETKKPRKIIATTWNNEFKLPDGCYSESDIQDHIEYIIKNKKHYLLILLFVFTSI